MNRNATRLILLMILLQIPIWGNSAQASAASPTAGKVVTSAASLNVRSGPSTSNSSVGSLASRSIVTLYEKNNGWWRVGLPGGKTGYCSTAYISEISGSAARKVAASALNVRTKPSATSPVRTVLYRGAVVVRISTSGDFAQIVYDSNKTGYVNASYLASMDGSSAANKTTYPAVSLSVPSYKQTDSRWASVTVGSTKKTIADIGCATTALAMLESHRTGSAITPDVMESRLTYTSGGSLFWPTGYKVEGAVNGKEIYDKLKSGSPVIIGARNASGGTHFVVVKGFVGGNSLTTSGFLINDPGSSSRTTLAQFLAAYPTMYRTVYR